MVHDLSKGGTSTIVVSSGEPNHAQISLEPASSPGFFQMEIQAFFQVFFGI